MGKKQEANKSATNNRQQRFFIWASIILPYCSCHVSVLDAPAKPLQIRVYDEAGNVIETHEHAGEFKEWEARR